MKIFHCKVTQSHNSNSDVEGSYRVSGFKESVSEQQLPELASVADKYLKSVHSARYVQKVRGACKSKCELAEVPLTPDSYGAMIASVTLAIMAARENGFAVTRPPGHHASKEKAEGFCFFNNVAVASSYLLESGSRVCIIDIDGHHGNGTQAIFRNSDKVLYCSIHQSGIYPYSGSASDIGKGPSFQKVINVPLEQESGDDVLLASIGFLKQYIEKFNPDHVAVSFGADGYGKDRLLKLNYTKRGFYEAGKLIASIGKPTFAVLEGGYHDEVPECVYSFTSGISGDKFDYVGEISASSLNITENNALTLNKLSEIL
ncbi:MAG: histone deacetylase family protein [Candidatus Paceibacterota bacterium]